MDSLPTEALAKAGGQPSEHSKRSAVCLSNGQCLMGNGEWLFPFAFSEIHRNPHRKHTPLFVIESPQSRLLLYTALRLTAHLLYSSNSVGSSASGMPFPVSDTDMLRNSAPEDRSSRVAPSGFSRGGFTRTRIQRSPLRIPRP